MRRCNAPINIVPDKAVTYCDLPVGHDGQCQPQPVVDKTKGTVTLASRRYNIPIEPLPPVKP